MKTSTDIAGEIVEKYHETKEVREKMQQYSSEVYNLSIDFHRTRLKELGIDLTDMALVATLDIRMSVRSVETTIANLLQNNIKINRAIRDVGSDKIYLFYESKN